MKQKAGKKSAKWNIPKSLCVLKEKWLPRTEELTKAQKARLVAEALVVAVLFAQLFYGRFLVVALLLPIAVIYGNYRLKGIHQAALQQKKDAFRECLLSVRASIGAGYAMENAWRNAYREMQQLYGKELSLVKDLRNMTLRLDMNETMEEVLEDFGESCGLEEAKGLSEVFQFAKRSGGNFGEIFRATIDQLGEKLEVEREIRTLTAAKRFEQSIMNLIPLGILLYLRIFSPGYLDVMYESLIGIGVMSICLALYIGAFLLSGKVVAIEV